MYRIVCIALFLIVCGHSTAAAQKDSVAQDLFVKGQIAFEAGKYGEAIEALTQAIDLELDLNYMHLLRGIARLNTADTAGALQDIDIFIRIEQKNPTSNNHLERAFHTRLSIYMGQNEDDKAIQDLDALLALTKLSDTASRIGLYSLKGSFLKSQGRDKEALAEYTSALRLDQRSVFALMSRAMLYQDSEQYDEAHSDLSDIINTMSGRPQPKTADSVWLLAGAYYSRALGLWRKNKAALALPDIEAVAQLEPFLTGRKSEMQVWELMGAIKLNLEDYPGAVAAFDKALQKPVSDKSADLHYSRAWARLRSGDSLAAIADVKKAIEMQPANASFHFLLGNMKASMGNHADAVQDYSKAITYNAEDPTYYYNRALSSMRLEDTATVCDDIAKAKDLGLEEAKTMHENLVKEGLCK